MKISQIRKTRENDYRISSTESKDLEIQLTTANRHLGDCEDGLIDVQRDVERLRAEIRWLKFVQIIGFVSAVVLAVGGKRIMMRSVLFFNWETLSNLSAGLNLKNHSRKEALLCKSNITFC